MTEKPVAHRFAYRYFNPSGLSATVLRHVGGLWNGQQPHEAIPLYTEAQLDAYTAELRAECERLRAELEPAYAEFEVVEDDDDAEAQCAYTTGPREDALREAMHYAAVYSKDGPVKVREVIRRDIDREASNAG